MDGLPNRSARQASLKRATNETRIEVSLDLDGTGVYRISTGVGFLDHMLEQLSRHSLIDLTVKAEGDLHIDFHHTTEDSGIVDRQAVSRRRWATARASAAMASDHPDGRDADPRRARPVEPALPDLEGRFHPAQARRDGHRAVQGMVPGLRPGGRRRRCTSRTSTARTTTTSSKAASRAWRAPCARRSRSTRASRMPCPRPRASLGGIALRMP